MECEIVKKNTGLSQCSKFPAFPTGWIWTPENWSIPAANLAMGQAAILAYLQAALLAAGSQRIYYYPPIANYEPINKDAVYADTTNSYSPVDDGKYRFRFFLEQGMCMHKAMFTHRVRQGRAIIIDAENQLTGTELSNGNFAGLTIQLQHSEKMRWNDGTNPSATPVILALRNTNDLNKNGAIMTLDDVEELYRIVDVVITQVSASATEIVVDVKSECDGVEISGLTAADFVISDGDGAPHVKVLDGEVNGRYTFSGADFEDGTIDLVSAATLSIKAYESLGAVAIDVT